MRRILALLALLPLAALAQSVPNGTISLGQIWTPAQWNFAWQSKVDMAHYREVHVSDYGAVCNNSTDDGPAFQRAANAAAAMPGGGVVVGGGLCAVATPVVVNTSRVVFSSKQFGDQEHDIGGNDNGWVWRWTGTPGGTMLTFAPILSVSNPALTGDGAQGVTFDCNNSAAIGLEIQSVKAGAWESLYFVECTTAGLDTVPIGNNGSLGEHPDVQGNRFHGIHSNIQQSTGAGVRLRGSADGSANTSFDTFYSCQFGYKNGDGILMLDTDNVGFYDVQMFRFGGGTGIGVELSGSSANSTRSAFFYDLSPGPGGITIRGTETNPNPVKNVQFIGYDITNSPPAPVLGTGVTGITLYKESGHLAGGAFVGGGGAVPQGGIMADSETDATNAVARLPNTTYTAYHYNTNNDGDWFDNGTTKWQVKVDSATNNFSILRQVGSGGTLITGGTVTFAADISGGSTFTLGTGTGACASTSTLAGGAAVGTFVCTGTAGASTIVINIPTAPAPTHGWNCTSSQDQTSGVLWVQVPPISTSSCKISGTLTTSGDTVSFNARGY